MLLDQHVKDWVHPFVSELSDGIVHSLQEGVAWIQAYLAGLHIPIKGPEWITGSMDHYKNLRLERDGPMQDLIEQNDTVRARVVALSR